MCADGDLDHPTNGVGGVEHLIQEHLFDHDTGVDLEDGVGAIGRHDEAAPGERDSHRSGGEGVVALAGESVEPRQHHAAPGTHEEVLIDPEHRAQQQLSHEVGVADGGFRESNADLGGQVDPVPATHLVHPERELAQDEGVEGGAGGLVVVAQLGTGVHREASTDLEVGHGRSDEGLVVLLVGLRQGGGEDGGDEDEGGDTLHVFLLRSDKSVAGVGEGSFRLFLSLPIEHLSVCEVYRSSLHEDCFALLANL